MQLLENLVFMEFPHSMFIIYRVYTEGACPCGRSWHTMTASSKSVAFLYGGYSTNGAPLSKLIYHINLNNSAPDKKG